MSRHQARVRVLSCVHDNQSPGQRMGATDFLRNGLIQHINDSDRRFGAHFHKVGLAAHAQRSEDSGRTMKKKWWKFW